jgi:aminopeptidase
MQSIENKYAGLLVDYCLSIEKGDKLFIQSTLLAEPLVKEVYRESIRRGAHVEYKFIMSEHQRIFYGSADDDQLAYTSVQYKTAMQEFDAYINIRAPYNLLEDHDLDKEKMKKRNTAIRPFQEIYSKRTADGSLRRNLCQYPTQASAQRARMSLEEYQRFVYSACMLYEEDPVAAWLNVRKQQQKIVDHLNTCDQIKYKGPNIDVSFSTKGRTWINSDGRTNMPSGEVFTGPVEESVNGKVHFTHSSIYMGREVKGVTLWIENGQVVKWDAEHGRELLDQIFDIEGARYFGEVAIGTNKNIQRTTGNILFDEKIGGTIHMAIGQSYLQTGGKNQSSIHWDMITDMTKDCEIISDGEVIYRNGDFII